MTHSRPPLHSLVLLACCITLLCFPGCKRKKTGSAGGRLSPSTPNYRPPQPAAQTDDDDDDENLAARIADEEALRALGPSPVGLPPDSGPKAPVAGSPAAAGAIEAANAAARAEHEAKVKAHNDRVNTERAVDSALGGILPQLRNCYTQHSTRASSCTVSLRVNRLGYVLDSNANCASTSVNTCIQNILGNVKVNGVKTDNISDQRTFNFR